VRERRTRAGAVTAALLGLFALAAWTGLAVAAAGTPRALRLHQAALSRPSAAVALLGLAAALALVRRPLARGAALLAAVLAALPVVAASRWFLDRFARDPFLAHPEALVARTLPARPLREARIGSMAMQLRLSPSASRFSVRPVDPANEDPARPPRRISVRSFSGPEREVEAADLRFLNDLRVLALVHAGAGLELRAMSLDDVQDVSWRQTLPDLAGPRLELEGALGEWRVTGTAPDGRAAVVLGGRLNETGFTERRWPLLPAAEAGVDLPPVVSAQGGLAVRLHVEASALPALMWAGVPTGLPMQSELWALGADGPRRIAVSGLEVRCADPPVVHGDARFACLSFDGRQTLLWSVDARTGSLEPLAALPERIFTLQPAPQGRWLGWAESGLVWIDARAREAAAVQLPADAARPTELSPLGESLGALALAPDGAVVTLYHVGR
jgi:hypothetical protein